jgi:hypothetical protein
VRKFGVAADGGRGGGVEPGLVAEGVAVEGHGIVAGGAHQAIGGPSVGGKDLTAFPVNPEDAGLGLKPGKNFGGGEEIIFGGERGIFIGKPKEVEKEETGDEEGENFPFSQDKEGEEADGEDDGEDEVSKSDLKVDKS